MDRNCQKQIILNDWAKHVNGKIFEDEIDKWANELIAIDCSIHFYVWTAQ